MSRALSKRERSRRYIENGVAAGSRKADWLLLIFWIAYFTLIITIVYIISRLVIGAL